MFRKIKRFYRQHILKDEHTITLSQWFRDKGDEKLRFNYPSLNEKSIIFDLGGYVGDFAYQINKKYDCKVYLFEPHPEFFKQCVKRFAHNKKVILFKFGLSNKEGKFTLSDSLDGSSFLNPNNVSKQGLECEIKEFFSVLSDLHIKNIDLIKMNIEGSEYPLLKHISNRNELGIINEYQIQFHNFIEGAETKRNFLINELSKTHKRTWCYKFVWENWKKI